MHNMVTILNNIMYLKAAKRVDLKSFHHTQNIVTEVVDAFTTAIICNINIYQFIMLYTLNLKNNVICQVYPKLGKMSMQTCMYKDFH